MSTIPTGNGPLSSAHQAHVQRTDGQTSTAPAAQTQAKTPKGSLEDSFNPLDLTAGLDNAGTNPTDGLPQPSKGSLTSVAISTAMTQAQSQEIHMGLSEVTRLLHMAQRENRKAQRQDMSQALEQAAKAQESLVGHMKEAAEKRHTAAVVSCCLNIAAGVAQGAMAGKSLRANENAQAFNSIGEASGRALGAAGNMAQAQGEYSASQNDQAAKLIEGQQNRVEKQYQEASSMLGDSKETMQAVMETLRALQQTQNIKDISRNL
jgi:hypothetical protein